MKCKKDYKDKEKYKKYKKNFQKRYRQKTNAGKYPRRSYTVKEDCMILDHSMSDRELADKLQRSVTAIQIRRTRLKKREERECIITTTAEQSNS